MVPAILTAVPGLFISNLFVTAITNQFSISPRSLTVQRTTDHPLALSLIKPSLPFVVNAGLIYAVAPSNSTTSMRARWNFRYCSLLIGAWSLSLTSLALAAPSESRSITVIAMDLAALITAVS